MCSGYGITCYKTSSLLQVQKSIGDIHGGLLSIKCYSWPRQSLHHKQLKAGRNTRKIDTCSDPILVSRSPPLAGPGDSTVVHQDIQSVLMVRHTSTFPAQRGICLSSHTSFKVSFARCSFASSSTGLLHLVDHLLAFAGRHLQWKS